ncbi:ferric reductase-like transmembrane domain-containing protein [Hoeflea sp.]|uniref:sulfite oxidase heme-binding subunit YedZ n=1 Tax=Hoeflea sp. TaxID=1940281 RepID=UPI0025C40105|nr:ferric reductase-like transmembrane domain-containing protein [Hoeflea sp.]
MIGKTRWAWQRAHPADGVSAKALAPFSLPEFNLEWFAPRTKPELAWEPEPTRITPVRRLFSSPYLFWALLALPAVPMLISLTSDPGAAENLLHPSGEFSARFMIIAMMITPLRMIFPKAGWLNFLMRRRRALGVAAFLYAALHLVLYVLDEGALAPMLAEFTELGIWTGWLAFAIFVPLGLTSNAASQRWLLAGWKTLQRFVYPAAVLTLVHWIFVNNNLGQALVNFLPLAGLEAWRIWKINTGRQTAAA